MNEVIAFNCMGLTGSLFFTDKEGLSHEIGGIVTEVRFERPHEGFPTTTVSIQSTYSIAVAPDGTRTEAGNVPASARLAKGKKAPTLPAKPEPPPSKHHRIIRRK